MTSLPWHWVKSVAECMAQANRALDRSLRSHTYALIVARDAFWDYCRVRLRGSVFLRDTDVE